MAVALVIGIAGGGCAKPSGEATRARRFPAATGAVAMIDATPISGESLAKALQNSTVGSKAALDELIDVRLLGLFAENGGLEVGRLHVVRRSVLARVLLERVEVESSRPSIPTDTEVEAMTERRWIEIDRPEAVQTCHVVVHSRGLSDAAGLALAERLADALHPLTQCAKFIERAKALPAGGATVTAEMLPPVTIDGRTLVLDGNQIPIDEGEPFDIDFARAAHQLRAIGNQSGIVRTQFGWHIILLSGRIASRRLPIEERRRLLARDILQHRASVRSEALIADLRKHVPISVERASIEAIGRVQVAP